jgi:cell division transport system permease protein
MRLSLENRREEVLVCKLLGATDAFIQRPFLYNGFWLGFCAGGLAWLMISITLLLVKSPIETLATLYQTNYQIIFLSFTESFLLLFISALLGVFGAWIVLYFQLKQIKPE